MIGARKKINTFDLEQLSDGNSIALALKFDHKDMVKDIVEKFKTEILGLNLRVEGEYLVQRDKNEIEVHNLPASSKFGSIEDMTEWAACEYLPDKSRELATIAANDDTIIININHTICDGKYIAGIAHHVGDKPQKPDSYFPITFDEEFPEEVAQRLQSPPKFYTNNENNTFFSNFGQKKGTKEELLYEKSNTKDMSIYNPQKKVCKNLTSAIVAGYSLSVSALNGEDDVYHLGGSMAANMRNELRQKRLNNIRNILDSKSGIKQSQSKNSIDPITLRHTNIFAVLPMTTAVTPDTTVDECYKRLNKCLRDSFDVNKSDLFDFRSQIGKPNPNMPQNGIMICFSNLGPMYVKSPVTDMYLYNKIFNRPFFFAIPLLTYAVIDEKRDRNDFYSSVRYDANGLTKKQADILGKSLKHYLETCDSKSTIHEVLKDLRDFQRSLQ